MKVLLFKNQTALLATSNPIGLKRPWCAFIISLTIHDIRSLAHDTELVLFISHMPRHISQGK